MMKLGLDIHECTPALAGMLEERGLISFLRHPSAADRTSVRDDFMKGDNFRTHAHGFHSVTITYTDIFLSSHPAGEDEIVFLWDSEVDVRPLYFVFAWEKREQYIDKLVSGNGTASDYVAVRFPPNDPQYSSVIVWHGTVHCELTDSVSPGSLAPSFFVLEPESLTVNYTAEKDHGVWLFLNVSDYHAG